ncbi:MAG: polysaccharide deacetylase family protein [Acutalibacteraceae bacterium]|jgi:peptidoglycan/xylan/chitin deacetylase (PgdA/CDA1 family)
MKKRICKGLSLLLTCAMLAQCAVFGAFASADVTEKTVAAFSAFDGYADSRILYGYQLNSNWRAGDGLPGENGAGKGVDLSGFGANGANKKMTLKANARFIVSDGSLDPATCWSSLELRLRSARIDGAEKRTDSAKVTPGQVTIADGGFEIAVPLTDFPANQIDWSDARELMVVANLAAEAKEDSATHNSERLTFTLSDVRIVREVNEGDVDFDELRDLVALTVNEADYRADAVEALHAAQEAGRQVLANENATQEQVDGAAAAIAQALEALKGAFILHTAALEALVGETPDEAAYTAASFAAYTAAKTAGQRALDNPSATQRLLNDAVLAIWKAKLGLVAVEPDDRYETVQTFSSANKSLNTLLYGTTFHAGWMTGDGLPADDQTGRGVDLSGDGDNGAAKDLYLQIRFVLPALREDADTLSGFKQIALRLRSAKVDGGEMACATYYLRRELMSADEDGVYTVRLPLRLLGREKIDWTDVRQMMVLAEVNEPLYYLDGAGNRAQGVSEKVGFAMGDVAIVRKAAVPTGDVDGENGVTAADALLTLQAATGKVTLTAEQTRAADVDGTPGVSAADALMILQAATGKINLSGGAPRKMVAFTFDDSPTEYTEDFLDELKARNAHITFFIVGTYAEQYPEIVARMAADGHSVGNHSYTHTKNLTQIDEASMKEEIDKCNALIEEYTGKAPTLFRAPWAATDERSEAYLKSLGMRIIDWVGYGYPDHELSDKEDILVHHRAADGSYTVNDGDILIFHSTRPSSMEAVLDIIDSLQQQGYDIVSVEELLNARVNGGVAGGHYSRAIELG